MQGTCKVRVGAMDDCRYSCRHLKLEGTVFSQDKGNAAGINCSTSLLIFMLGLLSYKAQAWVTLAVISLSGDQVIFREQLWLKNQHLLNAVTFICTMIET